MIGEDEFTRVLTLELNEAEMRKKKRNAIISRQDALEKISIGVNQTNRRIETLMAYGDDVLSKVQDSPTLSSLKTDLLRLDTVGEVMTMKKFSELQTREHNLSKTYETILTRVEKFLDSQPRGSPLRRLAMSSSSPRSSPLRSSQTIVADAKVNVRLTDRVIDAPPEVQKRMLGCLSMYIEHIFARHKIPRFETHESLLCESVHSNAPIHYSLVDTQFLSNPAIVQWVFRGKTYRAPSKGFIGFARDIKPPGYYDIELEKRFHLFRNEVTIPRFENSVRNSSPPSQSEIDAIIKARDIPDLVTNLEQDYGALDLYLIPNTTVPHDVVSFYVFVTDFDDSKLRTDVGKFFKRYILFNFRSSTIMQNEYYGLTLDLIIAKLIYAYLKEAKVWDPIAESVIAHKVAHFIEDPHIIASDMEEFRSSNPTLDSDIEDEYVSLISTYPPNLTFKQREQLKMPSYTKGDTFLQVFEKVIRPLVFLTDLGAHALFFKSQMRSGYYNLSQFYEYTDGQLILIFPELVFSVLQGKIGAEEFNDSKARIEMLVSQKVNYVFESIMKSASGPNAERKCADLISSFEVDDFVMPRVSPFSRADILLSTISSSEVDTFSWNDVVTPAIHTIQSKEKIKSSSFYAPHILTTSIVRSTLDQDVRFDEESLLSLYRNYIIATKDGTIGYVPISDIIEDVARSSSTDSSMARFKEKMHNCIVKYLFSLKTSKRSRALEGPSSNIRQRTK